MRRVRHSGWLGAVVVAALATGACNEIPMEPVRNALVAEQNEQSAQVVPTKADILFVIDNTPSMLPFQTELQRRLPALIERLVSDNVDFNIAVVPVADTVGECAQLCPQQPDDPRCIAYNSALVYRACPLTEGVFMTRPGRERRGGGEVVIPGTEHCTEPVGPVLSYQDYRNPDGSVELDELVLDFTCIATVGTTGRVQERGLNYMLSALNPERLANENAGFLRDDALLVVVFVANEDDCSHDYTEDLFIRFGSSEACHLAQNYPLLRDVSFFREGLIRAKAGSDTSPENLARAEERIVVLGIIGWVDDGREIRQPTNLGQPLTVVCSDTRVDDDGNEFIVLSEPATRYLELIESFTPPGAPPRWESICARDYTPVLDTLGRIIGDALDINCVRDEPQTCRNNDDCRPGAICIDPASPGCGAPTVPPGSNEDPRGYCSDFDVRVDIGVRDSNGFEQFTPYRSAGGALDICCTRALDELAADAEPPENCRYLADLRAAGADTPDLGAQYQVEYVSRCPPPGQLGFRFTPGNQPPEGASYRASYPVNISFD